MTGRDRKRFIGTRRSLPYWLGDILISMTGVEGLGVAVKLLPVAKPAGSWLWRRWRPDISPSGLDIVAEALAEKMATTELDRLNDLQVSYGLAIPVYFDELARGEVPGSETISGTLSTVASFYQGLGDLKRMLVLGEPGSGKTVLALHLIVDLLAARRAPRDPVPVRFNATAWDGLSSLRDFLVDQLNTQYSLQRPVVRALIEGRRIIPIIDGLDEMDTAGEVPQHGIGAVETFNEPFWRTYPLVVTCRRTAYETIQTHLDKAGISSSTHLNIRPMQIGDINNHVQSLISNTGTTTSYVRALGAMVKKLETDPTGPLGMAFQTPWILSLALAYAKYADPDDVAKLIQTVSEEQIADQLFTAQIPAACAHQLGRAEQWSYSQSDVQHWMRVFAGFVSQTHNGQRRTETSLDQLWLLAGKRRTSRTHVLVIGLVVGLVVGLVAGLNAGLMGGMLGLAAGLGTELGGGMASKPARVYFRTHQKKEFRTRLVEGLGSGLMAGLIFGLGFGLMGWLVVGPTLGLALGATLGLAIGLVAGLVAGLIDIPAQFRTPQEANKVIRDDLVAGLVVGLAVGLGTVLAFWQVVKLWVEMSELAAGLVAGLGAELGTGPGGLLGGLVAGQGGLVAGQGGLVAGLLGGLVFSSVAARYSCAVIIFRSTGLFAPRPAKFLKWSADAGLLRITGTSYQIRHDTYRQWLLAHPLTRADSKKYKTS